MDKPQTFSEAVAFARLLMQNDSLSLKRGYTLENAAIAVAEVYGFSREELETELRKDV